MRFKENLDIYEFDFINKFDISTCSKIPVLDSLNLIISIRDKDSKFSIDYIKSNTILELLTIKRIFLIFINFP